MVGHHSYLSPDLLKRKSRSEEGQKETSRVEGPADNGTEVRITEISSSQVLKLRSIFEKYAFVQREKSRTDIDQLHFKICHAFFRLA